MPNQLSTAPSFDAETLEGYSLALVRDHTPKIHTHVEAQIVDLDHDAQKVKGVIIDDTDIADQKVLAYDSGTERIVYITPASSGAAINSIQHFYETVATDQTTKDVTITEVDVDKTMLLYNDALPISQPDHHKFTIKLLTSTTVRLERYSTDYASSVSFIVLEFSSGINNIQRGYIALLETLGQTVDVTITGVDLAKTILLHLGYKTACKAIPADGAVIYLLNATTLRAYKAYGAHWVSWEVVEFS